MTKIAKLSAKMQAKYAQDTETPTKPSFGPPPNDQAKTIKANILLALDKAMDSFNNLAAFYSDYGRIVPFADFERKRKELEHLMAAMERVELETIYE
jgi:hypothetical protein